MDKPLMLIKLGSNDMLEGRYPWIPTYENLKTTQELFEKHYGDQYSILVYHQGVEIEVVEGERVKVETKEIKTIQDLFAELHTATNRPVRDDESA